MASGRVLIYGATGYTGKLVARECAHRGLDAILAGRDPIKLKAVAAAHGFETRAVPLDDSARLSAALEDAAAVLHIAGPFSKTSRPMADACVATRTHYLDVTGEIDVFEALARRDAEAKRAGVMLLPGVGFDVVPSDCLAAYVATRIEEPSVLRIGLAGLGGGVSRGTARTMLESLGDGLRIRHQGVLVRRPTGSLEHHFDLGAGPLRGLAMPLADLASAFLSTGIPHIETYIIASGPIPALLKASRLVTPLLRLASVQRFLAARIDAMPEGPDDATREGTRAVVLAEVSSAGGQRAAAMLETPSGYALTQVAAVEAARRAAVGEATPGFQTPATAYGADFVLECSDSRRTDL